MIKAILLAAGQSKRLKSENKLIKKFKKKALINHSLQALVKSKIDKIVIVLGYQNKEVRKVGEVKKKDFHILDHVELGKNLKLFDLEAAAKITGSRFNLYKGLGAKLERALINFMLDIHVNQFKYTEISPPLIVNEDVMFGTGQLPKFREDQFEIKFENSSSASS